MPATVLSVVMSLKDCEATLVEALESLPSNPYVEVLAVVNGSSDKTAAIARSLLQGPNRHVIETAVPSMSYARNLGFRLAMGKYVALMDGDDIATPDRFWRHVDYLDKHPNITGVGGQCLMFDAAGREQLTELMATADDIAMDALFRVPLYLGAGLIRRSALTEERYPPMAMGGDWWMLWQLMKKGHQFVNLPEVALRYRQHATNATVKLREAASDTLRLPVAAIHANVLNDMGVVLADEQFELFSRAARSYYKLFATVVDVNPDELPPLEAIHQNISLQLPENRRVSFERVAARHLELLKQQIFQAS